MRVFLAIAMAMAAACAALAATVGVGGSMAAAIISALLAAGLVAWRIGKGAIALDSAACSSGLKVGSALATALALVTLVRLTVFMVDASRVGYANIPTSSWELGHSCLTAYYVAGKAAGEGRSVFDSALYTEPGDTGMGVRKPLKLGPFGVDV
jgi:hypothetical protein